MTPQEVYTQFHLNDRTPGGVVRWIRRYINHAISDISKFNFADAQKSMERARILSDALQIEMDGGEEKKL